MAPLFHHANRQKTPPQQLSTNYTLYTAGTYGSNNTLVQNGSGLRMYYNSSTNPSHYDNNGYFVNNTGLVNDANKTITAKMSWNTINHGGWAGLELRNSSNQYTAGIWSIPYTGYGWRVIGFAAPGGSYNTGVTDVGKTGGFAIGEMFWLRIIDNPGANTTTYAYSLDGVNFSTALTGGRLSTVDQWCFGIVPKYSAGTGATDVNIHEITIA